MKLVIGLAVLALAALSQATKYPDNDFDLKKLNKAIAKCTPKYIVQSCKCGPNVIYWDDCMYDYLNLPEGPKKGSCVTLTEIEKICALYGKNKNKCYKIDKDGKPVESVIDGKDCDKDAKPVKIVIDDKDCDKDVNPVKSVIDGKDCDKDVKPVKSVIDGKDCDKDKKPIKDKDCKTLLEKHKTKEIVDDKNLSLHHSEKESEDLKKLSIGKDSDEDLLD